MGKASRNTSGSPTKKASAVPSSVRVYECTDVRRYLLNGLKYRARDEHGGEIPERMEEMLQEKVNSLVLSRMIITGWDESSQALPKKLAPLASFIFKSVKGVDFRITFKDNSSSFTSIASARAAFWDKLFPSPGNDSVSTFSSSKFNCNVICKHFLC